MSCIISCSEVPIGDLLLGIAQSISNYIDTLAYCSFDDTGVVCVIRMAKCELDAQKAGGAKMNGTVQAEIGK